MSDDPWHVCRDGLTPITKAVSKVANPDVAELVEWVRSGAGMFFGLSAGLARVTSKSSVHAGTRTPTSTRREMVRRWLQSNGHEADAQEFDSRLTEVIDHLQEWERGAKQEAKDRESTWKAKDEAGEFLELIYIIGQRGCDALNHFTDEASDTCNYLRQLDNTNRAKLAKPDMVTKYQEQFDAIGQTLSELHTRFSTIQEVPGIAMVGNAAQRPDDEAEPAKATEAIECHVTLTQMAAIVNKSKRTLERLRDRGKLPAPAVKGGKGKADEWRWSDIRPILATEYGRQLPEVFPADRFIRR